MHAAEMAAWSLLSCACPLCSHPIRGSHLPLLTMEEMRVMGYTVGEAKEFRSSLMHYFFTSYHGAPFNSYAVWDPPTWDEWEIGVVGNSYVRQMVKQLPIEVSTTVILEALIGIDEVCMRTDDVGASYG